MVANRNVYALAAWFIRTQHTSQQKIKFDLSKLLHHESPTNLTLKPVKSQQRGFELGQKLDCWFTFHLSNFKLQLFSPKHSKTKMQISHLADIYQPDWAVSTGPHKWSTELDLLPLCGAYHCACKRIWAGQEYTDQESVSAGEKASWSPSSFLQQWVSHNHFDGTMYNQAVGEPSNA